MPRISVIIPSLNEEKYIMNAFKGLSRQTFKDFEVITSDGGSKDKTRDIARRYGKVVVEKKPGIGAGRNAGARLAKGKILVFLDADTRPSPGLLKAYSDAIGSGVIAATGPILPLEKSSLSVYLGYIFVSKLFVKLSILFGVPSIVGSNFAIDRKVFQSVRGFNEKLITYEDWDLSRRIKKYGAIKFVDGASVNTSTRRVEAWGISGYFAYHVGNMFRYRFFKTSNDEYDPVR
ncbi:MAG: glycosyltransferase [Candidatus Micrarchaeota archaeon]|nr:glycosyltransferase [Candidatus Micrarchaeota archaeon]MDE1848386.1 glycosyltransferase [Candidatus Micrarchaeota archaeon]MDE1864304.1 glycosyltransferase [Candidatus Micrarchaeota archaeon]